MILVSHQAEAFNHSYGMFNSIQRRPASEIQTYTERYREKEGRTEKVQIVIVLQMAGSVWKSKHFKMRSSND